MGKNELIYIYKKSLLSITIIIGLWIVSVLLLLKQHQLPIICIGLLFLILNFTKYAYLDTKSIEETKTKKIFLTHILAAFIPILLLWLLYYRVLDAWWMNDDTAHLRCTIEHGILTPFYKPEVWRSFSRANLTPWIPLSIGCDLHLFSLNPLGFYYHHIFSFMLTLLGAYLLLSLFFSPIISSFILSLFVASVPTATVIQFLMVRQYLEGLCFSLIAFFFYIKSVKNDRLLYSWLGASFYFLSTAAKEVYVPLVLIIFFLPISNYRDKLKKSLPFLLVAGFYIIWRAYMLGIEHLLTGYGDMYGYPAWIDIINLPKKIIVIMEWKYIWQKIIIVITLLITIFMFRKFKFNKWIFIIALIFATLAPIVPVIVIMSPRYLFVPTFVFCILLGIGLKYLSNKGRNKIVFIIALALLITGLKSVELSNLWSNRDFVHRYRVEGEFILNSKRENSVLVNPLGPSWHWTSLLWIKKHFLDEELKSIVCFNLCFCNIEEIEQAFQYKEGSIKQIDFNTLSQSRDCGDEKADLFVKMSFSKGILYWYLGPYKKGKYYISFGDSETSLIGSFFNIQAHGKYQTKLKKPLQFIVKYTSPENWHTYSPILTLEPGKIGEDVNIYWKRNIN